MKPRRLIIILVTLLASCYSLVLAAGYGPKDVDGKPVSGLAPVRYGVYSSHKANMTIDTTYVGGIRYKTTAVCNVKINGVGIAWPTVANTPEEERIPVNVKTLVFNCGSTAMAAKPKLHFKAE